MGNNSGQDGFVQLKARAYLDEAPYYYLFSVKGQNARTLQSLVNAGSDGITALDVSNTWALRLSAYVHVLRQNHNLDIETVREEHEGGWHGRYILKTPVKIISRKS